MLRTHLWLAFLLQQLVIFALAFGFLRLVRRITGKSIHLGADPIGLIDGIALVALSTFVITGSVLFYRWLKGPKATPLGLGLSVRRFLQLVFGLLLGLGLIALPWLISLWNGWAVVTDRVSSHFNTMSIVRMAGFGFFLLLLQSVTEETANRAFPIRLWDHRSTLFKVVVPSLFFAALHLADEQPNAERLGVLLLAGVIQSLAYLLTGNIWFASGLHAGANLALFSLSGLWHAGALWRVVGQPAYPNWVAVLTSLILVGGMYVVHRGQMRKGSA